MDSDLLPWNLKAAVALILPLIIFFFIEKSKKAVAVRGNLPPNPKKLPIIGNLHQISQPIFRSFRDLAKQYGPIIHVQLGEVGAIVVSSPEIAKEILKDNDPIFANRPESIAMQLLSYDYTDIAFSPYGDYWREMRKLAMTQLLSARNVRSFAAIRKDEVCSLVGSLRLSAGETVNLTEMVSSLTYSVVCRAAFGKVCRDKDTLIELIGQALEMGTGFSIEDLFPSSKIARALSSGTKLRLMRMRRKLDVILDRIIHEHEQNRGGMKTDSGNGEFGNENLVDVLLRVKESGELKFPIGYDNIKAVIFDMFTAGTDTSAATIDWVMTELIRKPQVMAKAQAEVRRVVKGKSNTSSVEEDDIQKLDYLKLVIMESHRLHPQGSIIPRAPRATCQIRGYTIPDKIKVLVNVWAIQRDPKYWPDPETFKPERFLDQPSMDYAGSDTRYLPFGTGKRVCPGIAFGSASVALTLAQLLYNFDWQLPEGIDAQALNMTERFGITTSRKEKLFVVATPYQPSP